MSTIVIMSMVRVSSVCVWGEDPSAPVVVADPSDLEGVVLSARVDVSSDVAISSTHS